MVMQFVVGQVPARGDSQGFAGTLLLITAGGQSAVLQAFIRIGSQLCWRGNACFQQKTLMPVSVGQWQVEPILTKFLVFTLAILLPPYCEINSSKGSFTHYAAIFKLR
jgi:hypothetical protein